MAKVTAAAIVDNDLTPVEELRQSLMVVPPSEFIEWVNSLIYGEPGAGKTYLAGTAEEDDRTSPVLFLDIEGGVTTIRSRRTIDVVKIRSRREIEIVHNKLFASIETVDGKPRIYYKTVVVDSLSELADLDMKAIMKEAYERNPDKVDPDVPSQREWGKARAHMRTLVRAYRDLPCNVIFTSHVATLQEEGQPTKYFPGFAGKLRTELPGFMDIVGYLYPENQQGVIVRKLQVQGTRRVVAKDRTSSLGEVIEDPTIPLMWEAIHSPI